MAAVAKALEEEEAKAEANAKARAEAKAERTAEKLARNLKKLADEQELDTAIKHAERARAMVRAQAQKAKDLTKSKSQQQQSQQQQQQSQPQQLVQSQREAAGSEDTAPTAMAAPIVPPDAPMKKFVLNANAKANAKANASRNPQSEVTASIFNGCVLRRSGQAGSSLCCLKRPCFSCPLLMRFSCASHALLMRFSCASHALLMRFSCPLLMRFSCAGCAACTTLPAWTTRRCPPLTMSATATATRL